VPRRACAVDRSAWHARCRDSAWRPEEPFLLCRANQIEEIIMLYYAALFFVIALVAALFGFGGIAAGAAEIAKILFFVFLVLFIVSLIAGALRRGP
jgi:uncharacterized membrane protein YtjA (UPF0391 family)